MSPLHLVYQSTYVLIENVSTPNPSIHKWKFDSYTSSYMTSNIEYFEYFTPNYGTVEVGGKHYLEYEGKSTYIIHSLLLDGTSTTVRLKNVLYAPSLGYNLIV